MEKYIKLLVIHQKRSLLWMLAFIIYSCGTTPVPTPSPETDYTNCKPKVASSTFELLTWNLENFPMHLNTTTDEVAKIISTSDVDMIAFQEVTSTTALDNLLAELPGWEGKIEISGNLNLGFLYKTSEVSITSLTTLYDSLRSPFPRPPVVTVATHISGLTVTIIDIHLKCCGGEDNIARRVEASALLQQYIDQHLANDPVIIVGDYNDEITTTTDPTPFQNFIDANNDYLFADMTIAQDENLGWSYPSWPSHIDHFLITNELFNKVLETTTLTLEECYGNYPNVISDHRPVLLRLENK